MNAIADATALLKNAIIESPEYKRYLECEQRLRKQPELKARVDEFRVRNFHLNHAEGVDLYEAVDKFEKENIALRKDPVVNSYLEAELAICRLMQRIQDSIYETVQIHIPKM